jgi:hypothetical protein
MSYDMVEGVTTGLGEAFHKDIGTYDGSLGRLARYEAILDRSLNRLLNEYRRIQADRRRREKQHAGDWARAGLPPHDPYTDYDGPLPEKLKNPEINEAIDAGEITEATAEDKTAVRPSPPVGSRRRGEPLERRGRIGINGGAAQGRVSRQHTDEWEPTLGS